MPDLVVRPSLTECLRGMATRIQANRALMVVLLAMAVGSLASMQVMGRGTVPALLALPALAALVVAAMIPRALYALTVQLRVDGEAVERVTPWGRKRVETERLDLVRCRITYGRAIAGTNPVGKKHYLALDSHGKCSFTLQASMWKETNLFTVTSSPNGEIRGSWTNAMDFDLVSRTFGGVCEAW